MIERSIHCLKTSFRTGRTLSTTPGEGGWTIKDTSSSGTPTYTIQTGGGAKLLCDNTSEAQVVSLYQNDTLGFQLVDIQRVSWLAKVAGIDSVTTLVMGLATTQNDTPDSATNNCWFRMQGSASTSLVVVETDDGTTDNDDKATGVSLASTWKKFEIDFSNGISDVRFFIDGAAVGRGTTMSMAAITTESVQPFVQVQKASGTGVPAVTIVDFQMVYKTALGG